MVEGIPTIIPTSTTPRMRRGTIRRTLLRDTTNGTTGTRAQTGYISRRTCNTLGTLRRLPRTDRTRRLEYQPRRGRRRDRLVLRRRGINNSFGNATRMEITTTTTTTSTTTMRRRDSLLLLLHLRSSNSSSKTMSTIIIKELKTEFIGSKGKPS